MAAKHMLSVRIDGALRERIDKLAAAEGCTRTDWCANALARAALTASGRPQGVNDAVDTATVEPPVVLPSARRSPR